MPEKLPLPAEWYKDFNGAAEVADTDTDAPGETGAHGMRRWRSAVRGSA